MATPKSQRIGIWIIAIALTVGTLGGFLVMILQPQNDAIDQARFEELRGQYEKEYKKYSAELSSKRDKQAQELGPRYIDLMLSYKKSVKPFGAKNVTKLKTEDLKVGDGQLVSDSLPVLVYYIGWTPDGKIFDSSIDGKTLKTPLAFTGSGVIQGWIDGFEGMKTGGVRLLTIPADLAYGDKGQGDDIPPNSPLKFIVFVPKEAPAGAGLSEPEMSEELMSLYIKLQGQGAGV